MIIIPLPSLSLFTPPDDARIRGMTRTMGRERARRERGERERKMENEILDKVSRKPPFLMGGK